MLQQQWENSIIIPGTKREFTALPPVLQFATQEHFIDIPKLKLPFEINTYLKKDTYPLPVTEDREGYFDNRHYDYWLSGLDDYIKILKIAETCNIKKDRTARVFDFGCATGRVLRHFALQSEMQVWGCDINENHVTWCNKFLPGNSNVFQSSSLPHLQVEDNFFDIVYSLSVFTHIDTFETSWLCEIRRILKPGGIAYLTIHDESSWNNMPHEWGVGSAVINHPEFDPSWLKEGFPGEKFVSRWFVEKSYSANVFYKIDYIKRVWSRFFHIDKIIPMGSNYQTVLVLKK